MRALDQCESGNKTLKTTRPLSTLMLGLLLYVLFTVPSWCQVTTASMKGTVSDSAQARVPKAQISVINQSTGVTNSTTSDGSGNFQFLSLPIGTYTLTVAKSGFETSKISGITLRVDQQLTEDVMLRVGAEQQNVTVQATPTLVDTTDASLGTVVEEKAILSMPLNLREVGALALLVPGTVNTTGISLATGAANGSGFNDVGYSGSGGGSGGNLLIIDGMISRALNNSSFALNPPPEMVSQFKIQNNVYDASFGLAAGTTMNLITNSGTDRIHGSAWEYVRNNALDATGYFALTKPQLSRNQFGGAIGGPIVKDKIFYFGAYEGLRLNAGQVSNIIVPTQQQASGDFSSLLTGTTANLCASSGAAAPSNLNFDTGQLFDPASEYNFTCPADPADPSAGQTTILVGNPIPGNIIKNIDPVAQKVLALFPAPNTTGPTNYVNETPQQQNNDQFDARVDATLSKRHSVFGRYLLGNSDIDFPGSLPKFGAYQHFRGHNLVGGWTFVIGPSAINEVRIGYQKDYLTYTCQGCPRPAGTLASFGIAGLTDPLPQFNLYPNVTFSNFPTWGDGFPGYYPVVAPDEIERYGDTFTKVIGRHTIALGGTLDFWQTKGVTDPFQANGLLTFNGQYSSLAGEIPNVSTASDLADMELGYPSGGNYTKNAIITNLVGGRWTTFFVQDNIHVNSRLSVQAGLRWEYNRQPMDTHNEIAAFFPLAKTFQPGDALLLTALPDGANDALCSNPYFISTTGQCLVMSSNERRARGFTGYKVKSVSNGPGPGFFAPRLGLSWQPTGSSRLVLHIGAGIFSNLPNTNQMGSFANNNPVFTQTPVYNTVFGAPPPLTNGVPTTSQQLFVNAPSVSLQNVTAQLMPSPFYRTPQAYEWSFSIQSQLSKDWEAEVAYNGSRSIHADFEHQYANQPTPGSGDLQPRRPWPDFNTLNYDDKSGFSNYESGYAKLETNGYHGIAAILSYTYAKSLDISGGNDENQSRDQDDNNPRVDYGPSDFSITHSFVVSPIYELPLGRGKRFLYSGRIENVLAGGWQVSAIITAHTGLPFTVTSTQDFSNTNSYSPRPDRVCKGDNGPKTVAEWFNTACFTTTALSQALSGGMPRFGTSKRNILWGPGRQNWDLAFIKRTPIKGRLTVEFRGEMFNAFNHTNFGMPGGVYGTETFGVVTSSAGPRDIQLSVKTQF